MRNLSPRDPIQLHLRKIAHFVEFFSLGLLSSLSVIFLGASKILIAFSLISAPIVALLDETVQIFSGRGSSVKDVWIDSLGFFAAALVFYTVYHLVKFIIKKANKSKQTTTE